MGQIKTYKSIWQNRFEKSVYCATKFPARRKDQISLAGDKQLGGKTKPK